MPNSANRKEYTLIPIAMLALVLLFAVSPVLAEEGSHSKTIRIVGIDAFWGGPNTYIESTYRFGTGPVFVESGSIVKLVDNNDFHTLTLGVKNDIPATAIDAITCSTGICALAGSVLSMASTDNCYNGATHTPTGLTSASPCHLSTPYDVSAKVTGDQVVIAPGQTLYLLITGEPGTVIHFMCIFHPWMQGEFIVTD